MKLHIGGEQVKDSWKILNISDKPGVDYIGDIGNLSQFTDNSFEEIYASHVVEHVPQAKVLGMFQGIHRILKPGGKFYISVAITTRTFANRRKNVRSKSHVV